MNTYTIHDIAQAAETVHGIDQQVAHEAAETYLAQIEKLDDVTIDPDEIDRDTARFILNSIAHGIAGGDIN